jgi:hypothetical protein
MKIQRQIMSILSTILIVGMALSLPLQAQQSSPQPQAQAPAQQPQDAAPQSQSQPPPSATPATTQTAPDTNQPSAPATGNQANPPQQPANQQPAGSGTNVNPSQGPLQPVKPVTTYPDASGAQQAEPSATPAQNNVPEGPQPKRQTTEPVGAATAESVPTSGGAAAKPAGVAIAPAKQHQTRSLLVKVGAVIAAGAAVGVVYALTRSTSSTPPGANLPGVVQKSAIVLK